MQALKIFYVEKFVTVSIKYLGSYGAFSLMISFLTTLDETLSQLPSQYNLQNTGQPH